MNYSDLENIEEGDTVYLKYTDKAMLVARVDETFVTCVLQVNDQVMYPIFEKGLLSKTPYNSVNAKNGVLGIDFEVLDLAKAIYARKLSFNEWTAVNLIYTPEANKKTRIKDVEEAISFLNKHLDSLKNS